MKKLYKFIIILVITMIIAGIYYFSTRKIEQPAPENTVVDPIQNSRTEDARVDEFLNSFFQIYSNLANSKNLDMTYLSDVVAKNSNAYKIIESEINELRKKSVELQVLISDINITKQDNNLYVANVTIDKIITTGSLGDEPLTNNLSITINSQDKYKITEYVKK